MTDTNKPVQRRTCVDTVFDRKSRRIVIKVGDIRDPDTVRFRLEGSPKWTNGITIKELFWTAYRRTLMSNWTNENKKRKEQGKRLLKRPRI